MHSSTPPAEAPIVPFQKRGARAEVPLNMEPGTWALAFNDECIRIDRERLPYDEATVPLMYLVDRAQEFGIEKKQAREDRQRFLDRRYPPPDHVRVEPLIISWDEFMAEAYPPVPSLWGDAFLVKGGGYLITGGDTGVGKTILKVNLILALAQGRDEFLGFPLPGRPVPGLLLEAEGSRHLFRDRIRQIADNLNIRGSLPISFHDHNTELGIEGPNLGKMIEQAKAELAFLDPVGRFHTGNENDTKDWRTGVTAPLAKLGNALDVAFILSDHYTKPNENRSGQHKVRGSAAKIQDCGAAMRLEYGKAGKSSRVLFFDRVRDGALPDPDVLALKMDVARGTVELDPDTIPEAVATSGREAQDERKKEKNALEAQKEIEEALARFEKEPGFDPEKYISRRDLAKATGRSRNRNPFKDRIRGLVAQGVLEEESNGAGVRRKR